MPSDVSEVDAAVVTRLLTDATLTTLMPDGVYWDVPPINKRRFVVVSLEVHEDAYQFGGSAYERMTYLIKAVEDQAAGANVKAAAQRIHVLLQDATFTIPGYSLMKCQRSERIRVTEADEQNSERRWQQRGGLYELWVSP
jgi:Protein of unknown function (DUF3168)